MTDAPETIWIDDERSIGGSANILYAEPPYDDPYICEYRLASLPATDERALANPKVQALVQALELAVPVIEAAISFEDAAAEYLSEANYELNASLSEPAAEISVCGKDALSDARAALAAMKETDE